MSSTNTTQPFSLAADEKFLFLMTMETFGGGAMRKLAIAMKEFDPINFRRMIEAFPELLSKYGPGSTFYQKSVELRQQECHRDLAFFQQLIGA